MQWWTSTRGTESQETVSCVETRGRGFGRPEMGRSKRDVVLRDFAHTNDKINGRGQG